MSTTQAILSKTYSSSRNDKKQFRHNSRLQVTHCTVSEYSIDIFIKIHEILH